MQKIAEVEQKVATEASKIYWTPLTRAEVRSPVTHEEIVKWCQENRGQRIRYRALKRFVLSASKNAVIKAVEEALR